MRADVEAANRWVSDESRNAMPLDCFLSSHISDDGDDLQPLSRRKEQEEDRQRRCCRLQASQHRCRDLKGTSQLEDIETLTAVCGQDAVTHLADWWFRSWRG
eukprot:scaffold649298_cov47-Prasinocladus_malaysianus.AAC.1